MRKLTGEKLEKELERLKKMQEYEKAYAVYAPVCGIDEAGRGPLAGPVAAGAVILPKDCQILYLNDSKKLSEKRRELLFDEIMEKATACGVGIVGPERIDEINILQATYEAMRQAIEKLAVMPGVLLNDAVTIPEVGIMQVPVIKGDAKSVSIAAASILAKVTRDRIMLQYDKQYPEYGFAKHKGYGTAAHFQALKCYGPCPIHRKSFIKGISMENHRIVGGHYEEEAAAFLKKSGYDILEQNYRDRQGEIDLIAKDGAYLVFVEVKYRRTVRKGYPEEAVGIRKQDKIRHTAKYYLYQHGYPEDTPCRFDVVSITDGDLRVLKDAF